MYFTFRSTLQLRCSAAPALYCLFSGNLMLCNVQERFVKLEGKTLGYYKKKTDEVPSGFVTLDTADFVRVFDATSDCSVFEVQDQDRVFVFQCPNHQELLRWIAVLNKVMAAYKERAQQELERQIAKETPERIRVYDEYGEEEFMAYMTTEIGDKYYPSEADVPDLTLKEHLSCASDIVADIQKLVQEVQAVGKDKITR
jgi:hypothetical protein